MQTDTERYCDMKKLKHLLAAMMIFLSGAGGMDVHAEEAAAQSVELEEIKITASPIIEGNQVDRYAAPKTVVSQTQIEDLNAQDLSAALRMSPGVNISRYNPVGAFGGGEGGAVFIRGMGSSRPGAEIKTYVDGVPMYMSVWNHPLLDLLAVDPAAAIEVYKSPQPQYFGNAAAAINIVPKQKTTPGFTTHAELAGGSFGTAVGRAETGGRVDRFDYYLGGGYRRSDGHRDHSEGKTGNVFGRTGYEMSQNWDLYFFGLYTDNSAEDPGAKGAKPAERLGTYETRAWLASMTLSNHYAHANGYLKVYRNAGEGDWLDQPYDENLREDLYNDFRFYGIKAKETFGFGEGGELITGLDWENTQGDYNEALSDGTSDRWDGEDFSLLMPYAALSQRFGDENGCYVIPSAGARYYDHTDFEAKWAPFAGLVVGYGNIKTHAGYSRGVVYPGLDVVVFSEKVIPMLADTWKNLDPEIVDHYEAGISYLLGEKAAVDLTWFYNDGKDRYVVVPPPPPPPVYANIGEYVTRGVEADLQYYPDVNLSFFFGATLMDTDPSDLPYAPEVTLSAGANWRFLKCFTLNLDGQYLDDMTVNSQARRAGAENTNRVDSYFILNGKLSREFQLAGSKLSGSVFVAGENLTDTDYEYQPGYPMPGINGMAGVTLTF